MPHSRGGIVLALLLSALNRGTHILTPVNMRTPLRHHVRVHQMHALIIFLFQLHLALFNFSATL